MPELDFDGLRHRLEADARPPAFADIRARRSARTRRVVLVGAALATAVALVGTGAAVTVLRGFGTPLQPAITSTPSTPPPSTEPSPAVTPTEEPSPAGPGDPVSIAASPSGTLFAVVERCTAECTGDAPQYAYSLSRSTDLGEHWTTVSPLADQRSSVFVADDTHLWTVGGPIVAGSTDGGRTWRQWSLGPADPALPVRAAVVGGVAWFTRGLDVWRASAGGEPTAVGSVANEAVQAVQLAPIDELRAYALVEASIPEPVVWRVTTDGGAQWSDVADPCAGTRFPGSSTSAMAAAPDGALWVVCASSPAGGMMLKDLVVSTDGGTTWASRGALENNGYGTELHPFSATIAWRTGSRADILRTVDGTQWTDLVDLQSSGPKTFAAISEQSAVYAYDFGDGMRVYVTQDGGATWRSYPVG
jgi:photosystem II stability/assembly factor-like uncharacterized protein